MKSRPLFLILRILLGISLICIGFKTFTEINKIQPFVNQTIDQIQHKILKREFDISHLKQQSQNLVFFEAFLFISSGLLTVFGFSLSKALILLVILIDMTLIHNIYFYKEQKHAIFASFLVGIMGAVFNIV